MMLLSPLFPALHCKLYLNWKFQCCNQNMLLYFHNSDQLYLHWNPTYLTFQWQHTNFFQLKYSPFNCLKQQYLLHGFAISGSHTVRNHWFRALANHSSLLHKHHLRNTCSWWEFPTAPFPRKSSTANIKKTTFPRFVSTYLL